MEPLPQDVVVNSAAVVAAMGRWPTFHDANLLRATRRGADVEVVVHVFERTSEVDEAGYFVLANHHLVTLALVDVVRCDLPDGFGGDTLDEIDAASSEEGVVVRFESAIGSEFSWQAVCREAHVLDVVPCAANGDAT